MHRPTIVQHRAILYLYITKTHTHTESIWEKEQKGVRGGLRPSESKKMDVGTIFTTFDESEGARTVKPHAHIDAI